MEDRFVIKAAGSNASWFSSSADETQNVPLLGLSDLLTGCEPFDKASRKNVFLPENTRDVTAGARLRGF